jgi:hypothetical protein
MAEGAGLQVKPSGLLHANSMSKQMIAVGVFLIS